MDKQIVVTSTAVGSFLGVVGVFSSMEKVIEGIRAHENKYLGEDTRRTEVFALQPYQSQYLDLGEMHYIEGVMCTYVLTMDVVTDQPVGVPQGVWTLTIGIHHGTRTSRDSEQPKEKKSLKECQDEVTQAEKEYALLGCHIWYATAIAPDGKAHEMNYRNVPYS